MSKEKGEAMSKKMEQNSVAEWWAGLPEWQKWALGIGGTVTVVATGGAAAYAIATYGATATLTTAGGTAAVAIGKAALSKN